MERTLVAETRPIRVLQVVGSLGRGGTEIWLRNVHKTLDPRLFQFDYIVHQLQPFAYDAEVRELGAQLFVCDAVRNPWKYAKQLHAVLRERGPYDVLHTHLNLFNGIVLPAAQGGGVNVRVSHSHIALPQSDFQGVRQFYTRWMLRNISKYATHRLAASPAAAQTLYGKKWQSDPRNRILFCGIDLTPFAVPKPDGNEVRASLGISQDAFIVGNISRLTAQKNLEFLLQTFQALLKRRPNSHLLMVGEGELRQSLEALARQLGIYEKVCFTGGRSDVPDLLAAMNVFAFPTNYEGLGLVGIEAQAAGVHVVVTDSPAVPKEIAACPEMVTFLPTTSAEAWAEMLLTVPERSVAAAHQALKTLQNSRYDIQFSARELCRFYTNCCAAGK